MYDRDLTLHLIGASVGTLRVIVQPHLQDISEDLDLSIAMPPGYVTAMKYNLGVLIGEEYGKVSTPTLLALASESLTSLKSQNKRPSITRPEVGAAFGLRGRMPIPRANLPST
jgi:hypothetical protein